ncbi:hypothetical protein AM10699_67450 (plasmid) [Acaryochloris marina MBIC10699]|nr:hypothetical protein AM10699_67450 [Acaryochloris marina MBIC10699]
MEKIIAVKKAAMRYEGAETNAASALLYLTLIVFLCMDLIILKVSKISMIRPGISTGRI